MNIQNLCKRYRFSIIKFSNSPLIYLGRTNIKFKEKLDNLINDFYDNIAEKAIA